MSGNVTVLNPLVGRLLAGISEKQEELEHAKAAKLAQLKKPWRLDKLWVVFVIALLVTGFWFAHIFSVAAIIFIGAYISSSKKTMPDGERVKAFSAGDRFLGKIVLALGIALAVFICLQYFIYSS